MSHKDNLKYRLETTIFHQHGVQRPFIYLSQNAFSQLSSKLAPRIQKVVGKDQGLSMVCPGPRGLRKWSGCVGGVDACSLGFVPQRKPLRTVGESFTLFTAGS